MSLSGTLLFIDGEPAGDPTLGLLLASEKTVNVFETMKASGASIFRLSEHLNRLFESAKTAGAQIPKERKEIETELENALKQIPPQETVFLRLTAIGSHTMIFVFHRTYPNHIYEKGVGLMTTAVCRNESNAFPPEAKTGQFLNAILSHLDPVLAGAFESLFLNQEGYVTETRASNFFIVKNEILKTPEPRGILDGVTRRFVIECARKEGFPVHEMPITRHEVWNADEAFLTNTSGEIVPVAFLDGRKIGSITPGAITKKLMGRFQSELAQELKSREN